MSTQVNEGDIAPDFTLPASTGEDISLHDFRGKDVILYFYPEDDTPGCTREACGFRDAYPAIAGGSAVVLGISPDDVAKHQRFASKYSLPFPLLADIDHRIAEAYGAWGEKKNFGKTYRGIIRTTFLIGPDGRIKRVWRNVRVDGHVADVSGALGALQA
jgi:peroxiredoxin Q/BCP